MTGSARNLAALAAGLVSAVMLLAAPHAAQLSLLLAGLMWLAPTPLYAAGFAFGGNAAALGGLVAVAAIALAPLSGGRIPALNYAVQFWLPAALCCWAGLPMRAEPGLAAPGPSSRAALTGPLLGRLLAVLCLYVAVLAAVAFQLLETRAGGYEAVVTALERLLARMAGSQFQLPGATPESVAALFGMTLLAMLGGAVGTMHTISAVLAERLVSRAGLSSVPRVRWGLVALPGWMVLPPVLLAAATLVLVGPLRLLAINLFLILVFPWLLQGLAVVHVLLRGVTGRRAILFLLYGVALPVLLVPFGGAILVGLGLADHWGGLRRRRLDGASPREDE